MNNIREPLSILGSEDINQYQRDGFLLLRDFLSPEQCQSFIHQAKKLINDYPMQNHRAIFNTHDQSHTKHSYFLESSNKISFFFEDGAFDQEGNLTCDKLLSINKIGHALHDLDPVFSEFSHSTKIHSLLHELKVIDPIIYQSMYICKQPRIGGEVTCHQDSTYLFIEDQPVTGLWFALEDATLENGCLWAIPGGHTTPVKSRMIRDKHDEIHFKVYDETPWNLDAMIPLEVPKGSLIVLHGLLPHMSYENRSMHSRHAYALHVGSGRCRYAEDNWLRKSQY